MGDDLRLAIKIWLQQIRPDQEIKKELVDHLFSLLIEEIENME